VVGNFILFSGLVYRFFKIQSEYNFISFEGVKSERVTKKNFTAELQKNYFISARLFFRSEFKTTWQLSNLDFKYILQVPFICILVVGVFNVGKLLCLAQVEIFSTNTLPVTWQMLSECFSSQSLIYVLFFGNSCRRANAS
jgi:ABC-2 type transport system permease protein